MPRDLRDDEWLYVRSIYASKGVEAGQALQSALEAGAELPPNIKPAVVAPVSQPVPAAPSARPAGVGADPKDRIPAARVTAEASQAGRMMKDEGLSFEDAKAKAKDLVQRQVDRASGMLGVRPGDVANAPTGFQALKEAVRPQVLAGGAKDDELGDALLRLFPATRPKEVVQSGITSYYEGQRDKLGDTDPKEAADAAYLIWLNRVDPEAARAERAKRKGDQSLFQRAASFALTDTDPSTGVVRESVPLAGLRTLGSLWQFVDVPVAQALTYEVDDAGKPLDENDLSYRAKVALEDAVGKDFVDVLRAKNPLILAAAQRTGTDKEKGGGLVEAKGDSLVDNYMRDVADAIAKGRMLGDDLISLPELRAATGDEDDTRLWWAGLGVELARPIAPLPVSAGIKAGAGAARRLTVSRRAADLMGLPKDEIARALRDVPLTDHATAADVLADVGARSEVDRIVAMRREGASLPDVAKAAPVVTPEFVLAALEAGNIIGKIEHMGMLDDLAAKLDMSPADLANALSKEGGVTIKPGDRVAFARPRPGAASVVDPAGTARMDVTPPARAASMPDPDITRTGVASTPGVVAQVDAGGTLVVDLTPRVIGAMVEAAGFNAVRRVMREQLAKVAANDYIMVTPRTAVAKDFLKSAEWQDILAKVSKGMSDLPADKSATMTGEAKLALADRLLDEALRTANIGVETRVTSEFTDKASVSLASRIDNLRDLDDITSVIPLAGAVKDAITAVVKRFANPPTKLVRTKKSVADSLDKARAQVGLLDKTLARELAKRHKAKMSPVKAMDDVLLADGVTISDVIKSAYGSAIDDAMIAQAIARKRGTLPPVDGVATVADIRTWIELLDQTPGLAAQGAKIIALDQFKRARDLFAVTAGAWMTKRAATIMADTLAEADTVAAKVMHTSSTVRSRLAALAESGALPAEATADVLDVLVNRLDPLKAFNASIRVKVASLDLMASPSVADVLTTAAGIPRSVLESPAVQEELVGQFSSAALQHMLDIGVYTAGDVFEALPGVARAIKNNGGFTVLGDDLGREFDALVNDLASSSLRKSVMSGLPPDAGPGKALAYGALELLRALRKVMVGGMLGGLLLPNLRYLGVNAMTAPLIVAAALSVPDALRSTGITRLFNGDLLWGKKATDIVFTDAKGVDWSRAALEDLMGKVDLGKSHVEFNFAGAALDALKRNARLTYAFNEVGGIRSGLRWLDPLTGNLQNHLSTITDNAFRRNVFLTAIKRGIPVDQAADMSRKSVLDYSKVTNFEREGIGQAIMFWAFQRQMALTAIKAALDNPSLLARLARVHNAAGREWEEGNVRPDYAITRLPLPFKGSPTSQAGRVFKDVGLSNPVIEPIDGLMVPVWQLVSGLISGDVDRSQEGIEDLVFTAELSLLQEVRTGRNNRWQGSFPSQYVAAFQSPAVNRYIEWSTIVEHYDLAPMDRERRRAGEMTQGPNEIQWGFRSKEGYNRFLRDRYIGVRIGLMRSLDDYAKIGLMSGLTLPPDSDPGRWGPPSVGRAAAYGTGMLTPMTGMTKPAALIRANQEILNELNALANESSSITE